MPALNVFIDESGDFEFSPKGSRLFVLTAVTTVGTGCNDLLQGYFGLKQSLALRGEGLERFHATNDSVAARIAFFNLIAEHVGHRCLRVDSVIARKNRTNPAIREPEVFYSMMLKYLLRWVFDHHRTSADSLLVWTDLLPKRKKRETFEKAVKTYLTQELRVHAPYQLHHHSSASHPLLQVADYCCWAIARKWRGEDGHHFDKIRSAVASEFDVFVRGATEYY